MVKFKNNVTGFIYDSINGDIMEIFTTKIPKNIRLSDDEILFVPEDIDDIIDMFNIQSKKDVNGWEEILEWVE
jgi:hypothetical protein